MSMQHIRDYYGVPAKRGARVKYTWRNPGRLGTVVGSRSQYLRVRFDDEPKRIETVHATWELEFVGVAA